LEDSGSWPNSCGGGEHGRNIDQAGAVLRQGDGDGVVRAELHLSLTVEGDGPPIQFDRMGHIQLQFGGTAHTDRLQQYNPRSESAFRSAREPSTPTAFSVLGNTDAGEMIHRISLPDVGFGMIPIALPSTTGTGSGRCEFIWLIVHLL
jgi:hypothetical protein